MRPIRSYLYAPASNDRILAKVLDRGADAVILDLEDGVAPEAKARARDTVADFLADQAARLDSPTDAPRVLVRINLGPDGYDVDDLRAAVSPVTAAISLPKAEETAQVHAAAACLAEAEAEQGLSRESIGLHLLVESAVGVEAVRELARCPRVERFGLGAADLLADLGATGSADHAALDHVRGRLVVASRAAGLAPPVDSVHTDIEDLDGLRASTKRGRDFGFYGKSVIHPSHVAIVNEVLTPSADEVAWSRRVVEAADQAQTDGHGAVRLDGAMIDPPIVARARAALAIAELTGGAT